VREIMAQLGVRRLDELIGKTEFLKQKRNTGNWKAEMVDLTNLLHRPDTPYKKPLYNTEKQVHKIDDVIDKKIIDLCKKAISKSKPAYFSYPIKNTDRATGTQLSSVIASKYGMEGLQDDTINVSFEGSAGQSFGAFLSQGVTFHLEGDSNDYIGKGLSGGKIIVSLKEDSKLKAEENIIVGNVALYGAIRGEAFFNGIAGERFAVRNSGANAVVEGIGDHGCEYMTGGRVVVLGDVGRNFAAGMSGGIAYVYDFRKVFTSKCNTEMVELYNLEDNDDIKEVKSLIEKHYAYTQSRVAEKILNNWEIEVKHFVKVFPTDYRKVLEAENSVDKSIKKNINKIKDSFFQSTKNYVN
jgi:glutamate synthase domain-containing protein 3